MEEKKNLKSIIENIRILKFKKICEKSSAFFAVKKYFNEVIKPLYGDQMYALKQIGKSIDRKCELFYEDDEEVGMLVYKTFLSDEYVNFGIEKALEIKTLFVVNAEKNSNKNIATMLLKRVLKVALKKGAKALFVTASSGKPEMKEFFLKRGFQIAKIFKNRYVKGLDEYLFIYPLKEKYFKNLPMRSENIQLVRLKRKILIKKAPKKILLKN